MEKPSVVISCPIDTYSGYGARSRDFVKALINLNIYDVKILSQRWGNTSFGYLDDHNEDELTSLIIPKLTSQPDIWIQITVPNEFQKVGKYNIGVTAGIETTICDISWIDGCNRMDLILTSSNHSKNVFETTAYNKKDKLGNTVETVKLTTKVDVLFEGADLTKYFKTSSKFNLDGIEEQFCFLFVGHWLQGDFGEDRKNVSYLIKSFLETFKGKGPKPALILKTGIGTSSLMNTDVILRKIDVIRKTVKGTLPNIYLIDGDLSDEDINHLYNHSKVKAMISLTKGEGFGRPLLEFTTTAKPVITTNWSGHTDFLDPEFNILVGGSLNKVHKSAVTKNVILAESQWFTPDDADVNRVFKAVYKNYKKYLTGAKRQAFKTKNEFSFEKMQELLKDILSNNVPNIPKQVTLNLPKIGTPKLELPKLKKL